MKSSVLLLLASLPVVSLGAEVLRTEASVKVDGKLDEPVWAKASWNGGFRKFKDQPADSKIVSLTEFALASDGRTLFVGVRCKEPEMDAVRALKSTMLWEGADAIELFFAPTGQKFDFYHFAAAFCPGAGVYADFASECGKIHPDPYNGDWTVARAACEGGWSMEAAFPLSAFYMTRNRTWSGTWLVNVCRKRPHNEELTSWSQLQNNFLEPDKMAPVTGFPKRREADDMAMTDVGVRIDRRAGERLAGELKMTVYAGEAGDYELSSPFLEKTALTLKRGENKVVAKASYPGNGRHPTELVLTRVATGERYVRTYPVVVDFEDIRVKLTTPQYRDNFYPGQDSSKVVGTVASAVPGEIVLTLEGPGIPKTEKRLSASGAFAFDTPGFTDGSATLTVVTSGKVPCTKTVEIRKLAKTGHWMAWVEDGHLVINGKAVLPRSVYAEGYRGGTAFDEKFRADKNLYMTDMGRGGATFEPDRIIPGLEAREGKKDVMPCKEYLDKVDAIIDANRNNDFVSWYISDEPECRGVSHVYLRNIYEHIKKRDPYHVIRCASRGTDAFNDCADWIETHPYLNPCIDDKGERVYGRAPGEMGAFIEAFRPEANPDKCIGFLPTLFAYRYASIQNDYPTFREYVCHTWAAMVHGGKSLWPYAYHDMGDRAALYEGNRYVFSSFAALEELVLMGKRTWLRRDDSVRAVIYELPKERMFVVVNVTRRPQKVELKGLSGDFAEFRGKRKFGFSAGQTATFDLEPLETVIATTEPHDAGLPTYAATQALVDRLEAERVGRDSQILERYGDVVFAGSTPVGSGYKLIDGTRDVWAWESRWNANAFIEMSFPKKACTFRTVRVFGRWENDPSVSVRKAGAWVDCTPVKTTKLENGLELTFEKPIKTLKIRLSFVRKPNDSRNNVTEVYELEIGRLAGAAKETATAVSTKPAGALVLLDETNAVGTEQYGAQTWMCKSECVVPRPGGGFTLTTSPKTSATVLHEFGPKDRYLTARVESFTPVAQGQYINWSIFIDSSVGLCGGVSHPQPGVYMARLPKFEKPETHGLTFYNYNLAIGFAYVAIEENPADLLRFSSVDNKATVEKGDRLRVVLRLQNPCEELSAEFVKDYGGGDGFEPYSINGTSALTLNRLDKEGRYWGADFTLSSFKPVKGNVYVKVVTLGGGMDLPIFAISDFTFAR